jgi:hypothetical protein
MSSSIESNNSSNSNSNSNSPATAPATTTVPVSAASQHQDEGLLDIKRDLIPRCLFVDPINSTGARCFKETSKGDCAKRIGNESTKLVDQEDGNIRDSRKAQKRP